MSCSWVARKASSRRRRAGSATRNWQRPSRPARQRTRLVRHQDRPSERHPQVSRPRRLPSTVGDPRPLRPRGWRSGWVRRAGSVQTPREDDDQRHQRAARAASRRAGAPGDRLSRRRRLTPGRASIRRDEVRRGPCACGRRPIRFRDTATRIASARCRTIPPMSERVRPTSPPGPARRAKRRGPARPGRRASASSSEEAVLRADRDRRCPHGSSSADAIPRTARAAASPCAKSAIDAPASPGRRRAEPVKAEPHVGHDRRVGREAAQVALHERARSSQIACITPMVSERRRRPARPRARPRSPHADEEIRPERQ